MGFRAGFDQSPPEGVTADGRVAGVGSRVEQLAEHFIGGRASAMAAAIACARSR